MAYINENPAISLPMNEDGTTAGLETLLSGKDSRSKIFLKARAKIAKAVGNQIKQHDEQARLLTVERINNQALLSGETNLEEMALLTRSLGASVSSLDPRVRSNALQNFNESRVGDI